MAARRGRQRLLDATPTERGRPRTGCTSSSTTCSSASATCTTSSRPPTSPAADADERAAAMSIHVALEHRTRYRFDRRSGLAPHVVRLRPAPHCRTPILSYSLTVEPSDHFVNWQQDPFGNFVARLVFPEKATELSIVVDLVADLTVINPFDFFLEPEAESYPVRLRPRLRRDLAPVPRVRPVGPLLEEWLAEVGRCPPDGMPTVDFLVGINQRLQARHRLHDPHGAGRADARRDAGPGARLVPRQRLAARAGPAPPRSGRPVRVGLPRAAHVRHRSRSTGPPGPTADFTDLHAWCEVFVPGAGWVGLDPTSGSVRRRGPHPAGLHAPPGVGRAGHRRHRPVRGDVRVLQHRHAGCTRTRGSRSRTPTTSGRASTPSATSVDERLVAGDVRLTQGGEPTFVSVDDMDAASGPSAPTATTSGPGPGTLTGRLADGLRPGRPAPRRPGQVVPGRAAPPLAARRALAPRRRARCGRAPTCFADPFAPGTSTVAEAEALARALAAAPRPPRRRRAPGLRGSARRACSNEARVPAGEPPEHDVDPDDARLADRGGPGRGRRRARRDRRARPSAWIMPLHHLRTERGRLGHHRVGAAPRAPGPRPRRLAAGLRLPLDSLTWTPGPSPSPSRLAVRAEAASDARRARPGRPARTARRRPAPPMVVGRRGPAHRARRSSCATAGSASSCRR